MPTRATVPEFAYGKILEVKKADNGGLWVHGWAYDRFLERQADEIAVFWKGAPIFSGVCRFVMPRIRKTELTDFSFNAAEADFANEVLADKHLLKAYARFGDGWFELASSWQAPAGD